MENELIDVENYKGELKELKETIEKLQNKADIIAQKITTRDKQIDKLTTRVESTIPNVFDEDKFISFFRKPYYLLQKGKNNALVFVPKFIKGFQVGWLTAESENYYVYEIDRYSSLLGDIPKDILEQVEIERRFKSVVVKDDKVLFSPDDKFIQSEVKGLRYWAEKESEGVLKIRRGHVFDVIAEIIEAGGLPFIPTKVADNDIREASSTIKLRNYQEEAVNKFLQYGAVGVFYPTGAGKSFIAMHLCDIIKGKKIIIVPTRTLLEQWHNYIEQNIPSRKEEIKLITYQGYKHLENEEYSIAIFDECQFLPADTFSRLATINTKYRLGISASPHREDKRENYIFALTGFPVGLNWQKYMDTVKREYHPINVHLVKSEPSKVNKISELLDSRKTIIFSDHLELGERIAKVYGLPFISGKTENRLETIGDNNAIVLSRVGDLGISIKDLQHIIEVDFLYGSRQQELQRTGRLMHSEADDLEHDIIMTEGEYEKFSKRLWALQEKGFTIKMM